MFVGSLTEYEATLPLDDDLSLDVSFCFISSLDLTFKPARSKVKILSNDVFETLAFLD